MSKHRMGDFTIVNRARLCHSGRNAFLYQKGLLTKHVYLVMLMGVLSIIVSKTENVVTTGPLWCIYVNLWNPEILSVVSYIPCAAVANILVRNVHLGMSLCLRYEHQVKLVTISS